MNPKLPKALIEELDGLMRQLLHGNAEERSVAMSRLDTYEKSGRITLPLLLQMADESDPAVMMYAVSALGRSGHPDAVKKLSALAATHREGNVLLLETIVEALGETHSKHAVAALLDLIGMGNRWTSRLLGRFSRRNDEQLAKQEKLRVQLTLPVARALERVGDPLAAEASAPLLDHEDALVRCHAVRAAMQAGFTRSLDRIRQMADTDKNETVRELARIALSKLSQSPNTPSN